MPMDNIGMILLTIYPKLQNVRRQHCIIRRLQKSTSISCGRMAGIDGSTVGILWDDSKSPPEVMANVDKQHYLGRTQIIYP